MAALSAAFDLSLVGAALVAVLVFSGCSDQRSCGGGAWHRGVLEIHHVDLGQADSTLIVGPTGRSLLVDAGEPTPGRADGAEALGAYVERVLGCRQLDAVMVTHFHLDHVGLPHESGLGHLVDKQGFTTGATLHRDYESFTGAGGATLAAWRRHLREADDRFHPRVVREGDSVDLGPGVSFRIVAVDGAGALLPDALAHETDTPPNENDLSLAAVLRYGRFDYFIGGDLSGAFAPAPQFGYAYHDLESVIAAHVGDVDVLRVNHHGSDHSSGAAFVANLDPEVSIISSGASNRHGHPKPSTLDRLLGTSDVFITGGVATGVALHGARIAGDIVVTTDGSDYTVNEARYAAADPPRADSDGDGFYVEADLDDSDPHVGVALNGGCDADAQPCDKLTP